MSLETRFRVGLDGKEELAQFFERSARGARGLHTGLNQEMTAISADINRFVSGAGRALLSLGGLGAGIGLGASAKSVVDLRDKVTEIAAAAGLADDQINGLREQLIRTSLATNQFAGDAGEALQAFVAKTGDIDTGRRNLELYGRVATATRASVQDLANVGADLQKLGIKGDQSTALAILAKQADVGSVELKDLVSQGPRLLSAFQSAGLSGETGLRRGGALAQVVQMGTGNVERTSTSVEAIFRDIAEKADVLEGTGIKVKGRDRTEVLLDIIKKTKGDEFALRRIKGSGIFGDEAMRGVQVLANEYRATGGFATFEKFRDVGSEASIIDRKFELNTSSAAARIKNAQIKMQASADRNLGGGIDAASQHLGLLSSGFDLAMEHPLLAGGAALGAMSLRRILSSRLGASAPGGGGGIGGMATSALGALGGDGARVFVTNWPGTLGGGSALGVGGELATASKGLSAAALIFQNAGLLLATGVAAFSAGTWMNENLSGTRGTSISDQIADALFKAFNPNHDRNTFEEDQEKYRRVEEQRKRLAEVGNIPGYRIEGMQALYGRPPGEVGPTMEGGGFYGDFRPGGVGPRMENGEFYGQPQEQKFKFELTVPEGYELKPVSGTRADDVVVRRSAGRD